VPYLDALPTVGSLAGQALLGRKLIENWPVWLAVNVLSLGLFALKGLWLTVLLYVIFAVLSLAGWRAWRRSAAAAAATAPMRR
jgi:nicotinamide mononucleotide transporter